MFLRILVIFTAVIFSIPSWAGDFGLGIVLGNPSGFSGNVRLSKDRSIDFALAYDQGDHEELHFHSTYLLRHSDDLKIDKENLDWYWGIGARLVTIKQDHDHGTGNLKHSHSGYDHDDDFALGVRVPIGLSYELKKHPIEFFVELALIMNIIPSTKSDFNAGLGGRYYF